MTLSNRISRWVLLEKCNLFMAEIKHSQSTNVPQLPMLSEWFEMCFDKRLEIMSVVYCWFISWKLSVVVLKCGFSGVDFNI